MVEETENKSRISIWWDIENCHVPKDVDPHYIAQNITAALQRASLTGPIEIQVFGDTMILPPVTQRALSDTGITLNHVPRGNKDAADKAILVAMLLWALDNPPPANILLISGDGDFANALHRLRLKTYSILLAIPAQFVKPALTGAAKKLWLWKEMAQGQLAELKLSQSNGDTSSKGPIGLSRPMDMFQQRQGFSKMNVPAINSFAVPNGYSLPQNGIPESNVGNAVEHFRSLSLDNHPSCFSSTEISNGNRSGLSHVAENAHHTSSDRKVYAVPNEYSSPQKRIPESKVGNTSEHFRSSSLENHPSSFSSTEISNGNRNRSSHVAKNIHHMPSDRKMSPGGASESSNANRLNSSQSLPRVSGSGSSAACSMDFGQYPYFLPQAGEKVENYDSATSNASSNNSEDSSTSQFSSTTAGSMPRGRLKHLKTNKKRGAINEPPVKSIASDKKVDCNVPPNQHKSANNNLAPPCQPPTSTPLPNAMMSNPQKMSHDSCLDKVYSALKTLERDMLAPTESNLSDCIQYWDPQHERVDLKQTLNKATELKQITKTQLGKRLVMFFPPKHQEPWNCVDPGNMQYNHSGDVWLELQQFLLYSEKKQAFLSTSCSRYDAAVMLKNSCGMHIQGLVIGKILNLLQQAMQERKWLRKNGPGWAPLVLNQKVVLDWSGNETLKGDLRPSTTQANLGGVQKPPMMNAEAESVLNKGVVLSKLRGLLPQILKESTGYNLLLLPKDFEHATGMTLNHVMLGFTSLQELMKEFTDVAYLQATSSGLWLLYPVKHVVRHHSNMGDKESDEKALRQIDLVRELKTWLSQFISTVKDGYDIARVQEDFLKASGKDLNREGLDFNKLQCVLNQFCDVIYIARSPGGLWLAYPASHGVGIGINNARSAVVSIS